MSFHNTPFAGARKTAGVTKKHRPMVWENMLGTVMANSPSGQSKYFDYDYKGAHTHAGTANASDLRVSRYKGQSSHNGPRHGQYVLWGIHGQKSGQDDAVLGTRSGRSGGHAGHGQQPNFGV